MQDEFYAALIEAVKDAGEIAVIGVVTDEAHTAVGYAGTEILQRYFDGTVRAAVTFNVTGSGSNDEQQELVEKLCSIGTRLENTQLTVEGAERIKLNVVSPPTAVVHNDNGWIYMTQIRAVFWHKRKE